MLYRIFIYLTAILLLFCGIVTAETVSEYFQVPDPLFQELLSNEPGSEKIIYFSDEIDLYKKKAHQEYAKKFAHRYVWEEQWKEIANFPFAALPSGVMKFSLPSPENIRYNLPVFSYILHPTRSDAVKCFTDGRVAWVVDPIYQESYVKRAAELAKEYKDKKGIWALWAGDEIWESLAIKIVPKEKRYPYVEQADKEIKEKYGFGKYGMPDSDQDTDPFKRIAHRRWVSDKLVQLYKKTYEAVKMINPDMIMMGPDFAGAVPAADIEEMSKYFDMISSQSWNTFSPLTNQLSTGCDTKGMADLSVCPVWSWVQNTISKKIPSVEDIRERYSQAFRNGSAGLGLLAFEWYEQEFMHPKFNYPEKWRAMLEIAETVRKMNKVKFPKSDSAILYPSYSLLTLTFGQMTNDGHNELYSAYATLGPLLRSWFSFVSDRQIERNIINLNDYKILYIPWAKYETEAVFDKIKEYVQNGGMVVCTDPEAFTWNINGESLTHKWEELSGVKIASKRTGTISAKIIASDIMPFKNETDFSFHSPGYIIESVRGNLKPMILFDDGTVAASISCYEKGTIVQFASNIFEKSPELDSPYIELFKNIQTFSGVKLNQDIWRFKFPPFKNIEIEDNEKYLCLTNNNVVMKNGKAEYLHNLDIKGTYTYDVMPDIYPDYAEKSGIIPFSEGHLTNRIKAYETWKKSKSKPETNRWIVSWKNNKSVNITFDLKEKFILERIRLFYSGMLPLINISISEDGNQWIFVRSYPEQKETDDIADVVIPINRQGRFVRLEFKTGEDKITELMEAEIWGNKR